MITALASLVVVIYIATATLYLIGMTGERERFTKVAFGLLCAGLIVHAGTLGTIIYTDGFGALLSIQRGLSVLSLMLGVGFLALHQVYKLTSLATFLVPMMMLLQAISTMADPGVKVSPKMEGTLLTIHIIAALLGTAAFVLAAITGVVYLIQDNNLKKKKFGILFNYLPSVGTLDRVNLRLILIGFPIYTVAIILGTLWAWESTADSTMQIQYVFAIISWVIYAGYIHARLTAGWRGRRAALLNLVALSGLGIVLLTYLLRALF